MTKADIVEKVYQNMGFTKRESIALVDEVFEIIKKNLRDGEEVKISGFGNFVIREKKPRTGRNPQTCESIEITHRHVLTFKPSQILREQINTKD